MFFQKKNSVNFNTKIPQKIFFGHVFPKKRFQLKFLGTGEIFFDIFHFLGFFWGRQHRHSFKNGHFWKKTMYYYLYSLFFWTTFCRSVGRSSSFFVFFEKSLVYGRRQKKKCFFLLFFFFFKKSKNLQFSPHEIDFLVVFWTKKNDTFNEIRAKQISKWEILKSENCQILRSWFYTKIPKKYFFSRVFPKKKFCQF